MRHALLALLLVPSIALARDGVETDSAVRLNADGLARHRAGDYEAAARLFQEAVDANPDRPVPHFNLACALARLRAQGKTCEVDASEEVILEHLEIAVRLDPGRLDRVRKDRDLDAVRHTFRFQRLLGLTPSNDADLPALLVKPKWATGFGEMSRPATLDFHEDGTLTFVDGKGIEDPEPVPVKGRWTAKGGAVDVTLERAVAGKKERRLLLGNDGVLDGDGWRFTDVRDDCGI